MKPPGSTQDIGRAKAPQKTVPPRQRGLHPGNTAVRGRSQTLAPTGEAETAAPTPTRPLRPAPPRSLTPDQLKDGLSDVAFHARTIKGDEKGEAQVFLERFFRALGYDGVGGAGATLEFRITRRPGSPQLELFRDGAVTADNKPKARSTKFADLLWPDRVLIEMKRRGENLGRHYDQLFDYWSHIVPHRPPFAILCNFDEWWIYDLTQQLYDPVDRVLTRDLAERWAVWEFLRPDWDRRRTHFGENRVAVTRKAADQMAGVFRRLTKRGEERPRAQRFVLQLLVALVSEKLGLFGSNVSGLPVSDALADCSRDPRNSYDLLGGLFRQMATKEPARGGRFAGVPYFNGGLFDQIEPIQLQLDEATLLDNLARENWSKVKPEIFGTLFQKSMEEGERHAFGAHFTNDNDIQRVVGPTIARPWRERIAAAGNDVAAMHTALADLRAFRVLDPACGSGNFLFLAYREMKRLERELLLRLHRQRAVGHAVESAVSVRQLFGLDKMPFAVELARVTLTLAKELEIVEAAKLGETENFFVQECPLPLDNLNGQIVCADALFSEWPKADAIIGNPPYLGSRYLAKELGYDYTQRLYARFPAVPKMADLCTHWFRLAHDALPPEGRAGLVGTNTIRQNESREASLDYVVNNGGTITEAVSTEVWSGDAAVHVSIVNWVKGDAPLGPRKIHTQLGDRIESPWLIDEVAYIGPTLKKTTDVTRSISLKVNGESRGVYVGQYPFNEGFLLSPTEAEKIIQTDPRNREVLFPYMIGRDLVGVSRPTRWIIDFAQRDAFEAGSFELPFERVKEHVMPDVLAHAEREQAATGKETTRWTRLAKRWWQFRDYQPGMMAAIATVPRYVACSRVTKRPIFEFISREVHPDNTLVVFPFADDYSFGILQAAPHYEWFKARCSSLKGDFRYTSDTVFNSFPWPQSPAAKQVQAVANAAVALRTLRHKAMAHRNWSLRDLYRTLDTPGGNPLREAHATLDAAVRAAYAMPADADLLTFLLALNFDVATKEKTGKPVTAPGLPPAVADPASLITTDCIRV